MIKMVRLNNSTGRRRRRRIENKYNPDNNGERKTECEIVGQWRPGGGGREEAVLSSVISLLSPATGGLTD